VAEIKTWISGPRWAGLGEYLSDLSHVLPSGKRLEYRQHKGFLLEKVYITITAETKEEAKEVLGKILRDCQRYNAQ